ncbi:MAG: flagellar biosynthesis protein FlhA [Deltaproteobacteria bacterium]|nr:flagellar biosynthesis protein FlhA [Deltaproteobacteria bacterium]
MAVSIEKIFRITKGYDFVLPAGVVGILIVMILPIPPFLLDILLAFSITASLLILLLAVYVRRPIDFATLPAVLLLATLLRLGLNVAATRLILLHGAEGPGAAGEVIRSFGSFVVGGNYAVGLVVFLILVIINFVVITKGAGRIAEVAARFTLDAMPGKQLAIDADMNAGLIDGAEARSRRALVAREADFYGAMDGASKFVRGDAVACILITILNITGGLIIGVFQHGLPIAEAARAYTLLTIGDGLVAQIPALIVSTAAGLVVSHVNSGAGLSESLGRQFTVFSRPIFIASAIIFAFGLIPGFAHTAFFLMGAVTAGAGYLVHRAAKRSGAAAAVSQRAPLPPSPLPGQVEEAGLVDALGLDVGYNLIPLIDPDAQGELLERVAAIRRQFAVEAGLAVPSIRIRDNLKLKPTEYRLSIRGVEAAGGRLMSGHSLAVDPGNARKDRPLEGVSTVDPAFGLPSIWIKDQYAERARNQGYTVVSHAAVIATHITGMITAHAHELLGRQETQTLLDVVARTQPRVVEDLVPGRMSLAAVQKVLQNILRERESIREIQTILEALADRAPEICDVELLTEYVRMALSRRISRDHQAADGAVHAVALSQEVEDAIVASAQTGADGVIVAMEPASAERVLAGIKEALDATAAMDIKPVLVVSGRARRFVRRLIGRRFPALGVLSYDEIAVGVEVKTLRVVGL